MINMINNRIKSFIFQSYLIYLLLFIVILFIFGVIIFCQFGVSIFLNASLNSSRYLLSAMAQSLAAILAIVLGFSFVALQYSAKFWSPRVLDLFLKSKVFWWLLIIYGFSILYDLVLLRMLTGKTVAALVMWINFSVILTVISFLFLFYYAYETIDQLKPERIIQWIVKHKTEDVESFKRDTILPVADILNQALRANDPHTLKVGLEALERLNIDRIGSNIDSKDKLEIAKYTTGTISRLTDIAISENDESAIIDITDSLGKIGLNVIGSRRNELSEDEIALFKSDSEVGIPNKTDNNDKIADEIKEVLSNVGKRVIEREWEKATKSILDVRGKLLIKSYEERVPRLSDGVFIIANDFSRLSKEEKLFSMRYFMEAMRNIVTELIKKDIYFDDLQYNVTVGNIFEKSLEVIDEDNCYRMDQIIGYIVDLGLEAVKKDHNLKEDVKKHFKELATPKKCLDVLIFNIGNRGYRTASQSKKLETIWICSCLKEVGIYCALEGLDRPTSRIFSFLEGIEKNYGVGFLGRFEGSNANRETNEMLEVTENIITIIEELGNRSIEKRLGKSSRDAFASLIEIGMRNDNTNLKKRICETLKHMYLKLENKAIFKSVIDAFEKRQGHELDKFTEFKEFCPDLMEV